MEPEVAASLQLPPDAQWFCRLVCRTLNDGAEQPDGVCDQWLPFAVAHGFSRPRAWLQAGRAGRHDVLARLAGPAPRDVFYASTLERFGAPLPQVRAALPDGAAVLRLPDVAPLAKQAAIDAALGGHVSCYLASFACAVRALPYCADVITDVSGIDGSASVECCGHRVDVAPCVLLPFTQLDVVGDATRARARCWLLPEEMRRSLSATTVLCGPLVCRDGLGAVAVVD